MRKNREPSPQSSPLRMGEGGEIFADGLMGVLGER